MKYEFISKAVFLPEKEILVIGDLHLGFENMLKKSGILIPETQTNDLISDLKKIIQKIKYLKYNLKKIIFIGDIKHSFKFEYAEKNNFQSMMEFLEKFVKSKNIIFIKGNHDTIDYSFGKMKNYHIENNIAFIHGHKSFKKILGKKIKTIIMGHIHPSIVLSDKQNIKREKYKCFLTGKFKGKEIIILPSFSNFYKGSSVNEYLEEYKNSFSILPKRSLMNFKVHVIGENKIYEFGKIKEM